MNRFVLIAVGCMGAATVGIGAFQAHGLQTMLSKQGIDPSMIEQRMEWCDTGVRYLGLSAVALLGAFACGGHRTLLWRLVSIGFMIGTLLFSGSLLGMSLAGVESLRHVAPYGGTTLIVSWLLVAAAGWSDSQGEAPSSESSPRKW